METRLVKGRTYLMVPPALLADLRDAASEHPELAEFAERADGHNPDEDAIVIVYPEEYAAIAGLLDEHPTPGTTPLALRVANSDFGPDLYHT